MQILSPMRLIAAALFALSALLGAPSVSDALLAVGVPAAAAAQEGQTAPRYWQMYYNFAPPTDEFIAEIAAAQGVPYTPGRTGEARFYADDGRPIYPSNDGAVGVIVTVTLPAGDVLTRYGAPTGRYVSPDGTTFEQRAAVISAQFKQFEASCAAGTKPAELLDHVHTVSVARDLDVLRALSGDQKLNYAGFSYGTYLGAHYAELFPANTGRMVLDGALDPSLSLSEHIRGQARGFERALRNYVTWCQSGQNCPFSGDADAGVKQIGDIFNSADQSPVPSSDANRPVTGDDMKQVVSVALYSPESSWDVLNEAFGQVVNQKDASAFRSIADQLDAQPPVNTGANIAINCRDYQVEGDMATWKAQSEALQKISPRFASTFDGAELGCQAWGHTGTQPSKKLHAKGAAPILVIGTTGDPATPYEDAVSLADQLDSGQLLTWEGNGHTAYASSGRGPCVIKAVDTYLLTGTMPKKGLTCHGTE